MSRLYGAKVDEERWKITKINGEGYPSYKLIDKEQEEIYFLNNIIGVEQVATDEFLVYDRYNYDNFRITRYKAENSKLINLFKKEFTNFHFITSDRIIFTYYDNRGRYRSSGIYSIKNNDYVEDGKWLDTAAVEVFNYENKPDKTALLIENENYSSILGNPKLLYTVDSEKLEPNSDCYSTLRNSFIKANSKEDIERIKKEDYKYIRIIEDYMLHESCEQYTQAKEKILTKLK